MTTVQLNTKEVSDQVFTATNLAISILAMDLPDKTAKQRKAIEAQWMDTLPTLDNVTVLSMRHRVSQEFFEAICAMKSLQSLWIWSSTAEDISSIGKLVQLTTLNLWSFSKLTDITPLISLKNLKDLTIDNCFNVTNYEIIGQLTQLERLALHGDTLAPRNLKLPSLIPFETLKNLIHLNLQATSVIDGSYDSILKMTAVEKFDVTVKIPVETKELIKRAHRSLKEGTFFL